MIAAALIAFFGFTLSGPYSLGKLLAVALVGCWLATGRYRHKPSVWPLAYLAVIVLTTLTGSDLWLSIWNLHGTFQAGLLCALLLIPYWACVGPADRPGLEMGLRLGSIVMATVGLLQLGGYLLPYPLPTGNRVYSTMGSPIYLGAMGALCFPFLRSNIERTFLIAVLWASGSRGAWVAVAVGAIYQVWPGISRRVRVWGLLAIGTGLCAAFYLRPVSDLGRVVVWAASVDAFLSRPWIGWGTGTYLNIAEIWRNPLWEEVYGPSTQDHAHNLFLEAACTSGILGLIALCGLLYTLWKMSDRGVRSALLGVFVCGMLNPLPLVVKALCLALAASCAKNSSVEIIGVKKIIVKALSAFIFAAVLFQVHCDRILTFYNDTAWSFSSVKAAFRAGVLKRPVTRRMFKL